MKPLMLCLGNEVLSDDAFGFRIAEALAKTNLESRADITTAALAGFALLDILQGRETVLIVDTVITGLAAPGELQFYPRGHWTPSRGLAFSHQISLPTALRLGELLGYNMPRTIDVLAVEAADVTTLSEQMTPAVNAAVGLAVEMILKWIESHSLGGTYAQPECQEAVA